MQTERDFRAELDELDDTPARPAEGTPGRFNWTPSTPLAREVVESGVPAVLDARTRIEAEEKRETARRESSPLWRYAISALTGGTSDVLTEAAKQDRDGGALGTLGALDEAGQKEWIVNEKSAADRSLSFWGGLKKEHLDSIKSGLAPVLDYSPQGFLIGKAAGVDGPLSDQFNGWLERKVAENITTARRRRLLAEEMERGERPGPKFETWRATADDVARGVGQVVSSGIKGLAYGVGSGQFWEADPILGSILKGMEAVGYAPHKGTMSKAQQTWLYQFGQYVEDESKRLFPEDQARQEEFRAKLAEGAGSMIGFMGAGYAAMMIGRGPAVGAIASGLMGGLSQAGSMTDDALKKYLKDAQAANRPLTAEEERKATEVWLLGLGIGATEAVPLAHFFSGHSGKFIRAVLLQATEEGGQEWVQQVLENVVAQRYYDPDRKWDDNAWEGMAIGAILGAKMEGGKTALDRLRDKTLEDEPEVAPPPVPMSIPDLPSSVAAGPDVLPMLDGKEKGKGPKSRTVKPVDPDLEKYRQILAPHVAPDTDAVETRRVLGKGLEEIAKETVPGDAVSRVAGVVSRKLETGTVPTFQEMLSALPKDERGDPDMGRLADELDKVGVRAWNALNDDQRRQVYEAVAPVVQAVEANPEAVAEVVRQVVGEAPAEESVAEARRLLKQYRTDLDVMTERGATHRIDEIKGEIARLEGVVGKDRAAPAATPAAPVSTADLRTAFDRVLASRTKRADWAKTIGASKEQFDALVNEALADGRLKKTKAGGISRTGKKVAIPAPATGQTAGQVSAQPVDRAQEQPAEKPATRTMDRAAEKRLETVKNPVVRQHAQALLEGDAESALAALKKDRKVTKDVLDKIVKVYAGAKAPKTKAAGYDLIERLIAERAKRAEPASPAVPQPAPSADLQEREAAARAIMESPEWQSAMGAGGIDTSRAPDFNTDEWRARRVYNTPDGQIQGFDAARDYLINKAFSAVPDGTVNDRTVFVLLGLPGAGKSTIADAIRKSKRAAHIVADDAKLIIPEYDGGKNSGGVHEESALFADAMSAKAMKTGANIIIEKLGSSDASIARVASLYKANGYKVVLVDVSVPKAIAMERAVSRWRRTGRAVPIGVYDTLNVPAVISIIESKGLIDEAAQVQWQEPTGWELTKAGPELQNLVIPSRVRAPVQPGVGGRDSGQVPGSGVEAPRPQDGVADDGGRTGDGVREGARDVPEGESAGDLPTDEGVGGVEGAPQGDRGTSLGDVRGDGAPDDGAEPAGRALPGEGKAVRSDAGVDPRDGDERSRIGRIIEETEAKVEADRADRAARNYLITDDDQIGQGGPKAKVRANIDAIRIVRTLEEEKREATEDERRSLVKYVGWGAFAQDIFADYKPEWAKERQALKDLLSPEEYEAARRSTQNAHYTSPDVIKGMWEALAHLGFKGGRALEPSAGVGHFIGMMPQALRSKVEWTAVELDPTTGAIAKALYSGSDVRVQGFETVNWPDGFFDLAISNVPFGNYPIRDTRYKRSYNIHDYFFIKSLDKVRPGGIVAFITSAGTLDKASGAARKAMADRATFLGAIRLPGGKKGAFAGNAGTEVTTDIIFLRRRMDGEPQGDLSWLETKEIKTKDGPAEINGYFANNPDMMLGEMRLTGTMYGVNEPVLIGSPANLDAKIADAAKAMPANAFIERRQAEKIEVAPEVDSQTDGIKEGAFYDKDGKLFRKIAGVGIEQKVAAAEAAKIRSFMAIRDTVNLLLARQSRGDKTGLDGLRESLNAEYDAFVKANGPINKTTINEWVDKKTGKPRTTVRRPNLAAFRDDPDAYKVAAIENYDEQKNTATKAAIFTADIVASYERPTISGPADALAVSLNETGTIDMPRIAAMMDMSETAAAEALGDRVYLNPNGDVWQTADLYLGGDVVTKLEEARAAATINPAYARNIAALEAVQPVPLTREDIFAPMGAPWIPAGDYEAFLRQLMGVPRYARIVLKLNPITKKWGFEEKPQWPGSAQAQWGTEDVAVTQIIEAALNSTPVRVFDTIRVPGEGEKRVLTPKATQEAQAKVAALREAWAGNSETGTEGWIWSDDERARRLETLYNSEFNRLVPIKSDGSHLTLPGISAAVVRNGKPVPFELRPHQKNAIWRVITQGNTLFDHTVGAGKTYTMIAAAMEQKRLGLVQRPMVAVPNHMLEQFSSAWLRAYPNAKLLVADKDSTSRDKRKEFTARVAAERWDAIIITHDAFGRIRMSDDAYQNFYREQIFELQDAIDEEVANGDRKKSPTVKQLERMKETLKAKMDALVNKERKDDGIIFEELGVDQVIVDEAHLFKNLQLVTRHNRVKGLATSASQRATDLFLKIQHIEKSKPGRSAIFATGTPVSNTMAEMYTMQRYLQMGALKQFNIDKFDAWAATFGEITTDLELGTDGRSFQEVTSFSKFVNIPELVQIYSRVADTLTADMLNLPRPTLKGGAPIVVTAEPSAAEEAHMRTLIDRADAIKSGKVKPDEDNMLAIMTEGRKVATDIRLLMPDEPANPEGKISKAVENIHRIWQDGKDPALAQIVFLDMGVPGRKRKIADKAPIGEASPESQIESIRKALKDEAAGADEETGDDNEAAGREETNFFSGDFNLYDEIAGQLVARGVPRTEIAYIHDAKTDEAKAKLFGQVRSGRVRILIGSTGKMGVGTNVQSRLIAMHHIDAPWKPAEVEQRDGRIIRQGNLNKEVEVYRYVTTRSLDAFMWQTLQRKANFIAQLRAGAKGIRVAEDIDNPLPEAAAIKAAASGDPRILEHAELNKELRELEAGKRAQSRSREAARQSLAETQKRIALTTAILAKYEADAARVTDTRGDNFRMVLEIAKGKEVADRRKAADAIQAYLWTASRGQWTSSAVEHEIGTISGFNVVAETKRTSDGMAMRVLVRGEASYGEDGRWYVLTEKSDLLGVVRRVENMVAEVPVLAQSAKTLVATLEADVARLERQAGSPVAFARESRLQEVKGRIAEIEGALKPTRQPEAGQNSSDSTIPAAAQMSVEAFNAKKNPPSSDGALYALAAPPRVVSENTARRAVMAAVKSGKAVELGEKQKQSLRAAMARMPSILPDDTRSGFVVKVAPNKPGSAQPLRAWFELSDGSTVSLDGTLDSFIGNAAAFLPTRKGSLVLHFVYAPLTEDAVPTLTGRRWHEAIHAIYTAQMFDPTTWGLLVGHADSIGVLDMPLRAYLTAIGEDSSGVPDVSLRDAYTKAYKPRMSKVQLQDALEQESVAIMTELLVMGVDLPLPENIRSILSEIERGEFAGGRTPVSRDMPALAAFGGSLPIGISFERNRSDSGGTYYDLYARNWYGAKGRIGHATVRDLGDRVQVGYIGLEPEYQRKGIATAIYGQIERDFGKPLVPDTNLSDLSYSFWMKHRPDAVEGKYEKSEKSGEWLLKDEGGGQLLEQLATIEEAAPLFAFGGYRAVTADHDALARAKSMEAAGKSAREIHRETGWFKRADGWRFEIDDSDIEFKFEQPSHDWRSLDDEEMKSALHLLKQERGDAQKVLDRLADPAHPKTEHYARVAELVRSGTVSIAPGLRAGRPDSILDKHDSYYGTLENLITAPSLFAAYPQLRSVHVDIGSVDSLVSSGGIDPTNRRISIAASQGRAEVLNTLIHELQHAIQLEEGFDAGGNMSTVKARTEVAIFELTQQIAKTLDEDKRAELTKLRDELKTQAQELSGGIAGFGATERGIDSYMRLLGEVEARNASSRREMSAGQRRGSFPLDTEDIQAAEQYRGSDLVRLQVKNDAKIDQAIAREFAKLENMTYVDGLGSVNPYGFNIDGIEGSRGNFAKSVDATAESIAEQVKIYGATALSQQLRKSAKRAAVQAKELVEFRKKHPDSPRDLEGQAQDARERHRVATAIADMLDGIVRKSPELGPRPTYEVKPLAGAIEIEPFKGKDVTDEDIEQIEGRVQSAIKRLLFSRISVTDPETGKPTKIWLTRERISDILSTFESHGIDEKHGLPTLEGVWDLLVRRNPRLMAEYRHALDARAYKWNKLNAGLSWSMNVLSGMTRTSGQTSTIFSKETQEAKTLSRHFGATRIEDIGPNDPHPGRVLAFHGTVNEFEGDRFDVGKSRSLGIHFGSQQQTGYFAGNPDAVGDVVGAVARQTATRDGGRVYPVVLDLQNVVTLSDLTYWDTLETAKAVESAVPETSGLVARIESLSNRPFGPTWDMQQIIRDALTGVGIDGIRYQNKFVETEGPGWSYIVWEPGKVISATSGNMLFALGGRVETAAPRKPLSAFDDEIAARLDDDSSASPDVYRSAYENVLKNEFRFRSVTVTPGSEAMAADVIKGLRLISEVTGLPSEMLGVMSRVKLTVKARKNGSNLGGFRPLRLFLFGEQLNVHGLGASTVIHEMAHAIDAALAKRRGQMASTRPTWLRRVLEVLLFTPGLNVVGLPFAVIAYGVDRNGWLLGDRARLNFTWLEDEVAGSMADIMSALDHAGSKMRRDSIRWDNGKISRYFSHPKEMFARAFEWYIVDGAKAIGYHRLTLHSLITDGSGPQPSLDVQTANAVRSGFDRLFTAMRGSSRQMMFALGGGISNDADIDSSTGQSMRRDLDNLGFYSKALEAARGLKQEKGTPEQMLAQLKKAGVKDAEIEATGLADLFKKAGSTTALESDAITLSQNPQQQGDRTASPPRRARLNQITKADIVKHLEENRVGLREVVRTPEGYDDIRAIYGRNRDIQQQAIADARNDPALSRVAREPDETQFLMALGRIATGGPPSRLMDIRGTRRAEYDAARRHVAAIRASREVAQTQTGELGRAQERTTKWEQHSLDPSNPTYRETVIHLPSNERKAFKELGLDERTENLLDDDILAEIAPDSKYATDFRSGHFPEPNIIGHMMTSMTRHEGKPVYTIDQIQSDWGQRLRDDGVRDEAKIATLRQRMEDAKAATQEHMNTGPAVLGARIDTSNPTALSSMIMTIRAKASGTIDRAGDPVAFEWRKRHEDLQNKYNMALAELRTAEASAPGHPLVNTTDQWTQTTLRRAIRQAVEAGAEYIAVPHGDTVLSYNPGGEDGMRGFYGTRTSEGIIPKNLRKLLGALDKAAAAPVRVEKLETTRGLQGWQGDNGTAESGRRTTGWESTDATRREFEFTQTGFTLFPLTDKIRQSVMEDGQPMFALGGFRPDPEPAGKASLNTVIQTLKDTVGVVPTQTLLGVTIKAGDQEFRLNPRGNVAGQTMMPTGAVGTRKSRHLEAIAHETAHYLETTLGSEILDLQRDHQADLMQFYDAVPDRPYSAPEAFAEFFRSYLTDPAGVQALASNLVQAFEDVAEANGMLDRLHETQSLYQEWLARATPEELASDVVSVHAGNSWTELKADRAFQNIPGKMATAYTALIDDLNPLQKIVRKLLETADRNGVTDAEGRPISLKVADNPYKIARMFRGSYGTGYAWLTKGIANRGETSIAFRPLSRALETLFGSNRKMDWDPAMYQAAGQYLISRRAIAEYDRLEGKEARLEEIDGLLEQGADAWRRLSIEDQRARETLDRRETALARQQTLLRDRQTALRGAESNLVRLQERLDAKKDDVLAAQMARDQSLTDRRRRDLSILERDQQRALRETQGLIDEFDSLSTDVAMLTAEIEQTRNRRDGLQQQLSGIDEAVTGLRREREATANRGASRAPTKEPKAWHQDYIAKIEADPKYARIRDFAAMVYEFSHGMLTLKHQHGLISDDLFAELSKRKDWYVPFQRDMTDASPEDVFFRGAGIEKWSPIKKFDGSDRAIINPLETMAADAYTLAQQIAFNSATDALARLAERAGPGSASIAQVLTREESAEANAATFDRIKGIAMSMGVDEADALRIVGQLEQNFAGSELSLVWSPATKGPVNLPTVPLYRNGERVLVRFTDPEFGTEAYNALSGMGKETAGLISEVLGYPSRLLQQGVTTHPTFIPRNLFRDIFDAWIKTGALPIVTQWRGVRAMRDANFFRGYLEAGGITGGRNLSALTSKEKQVEVLDLADKAISKGNITLGSIAGGLLGAVAGGPLAIVPAAAAGAYLFNRFGALETVESVETMTRLGVAAYAFDRAKKHNPNLTDTEAMLDAAFVARDVFDWNRRGSRMIAVVRTITFMNAQIQGLDAAFRRLGGENDRGIVLSKHMNMVWRHENGGKLSADEERALGDAYKTFGRMALYTGMLIALYALATSGGEDDDRDKAYQDIKDKTKSTHSWLPRVFGTDLRLPKAFEWALPANAVEAIADKIRGRDPQAWDRIVDSVYEIAVPPTVPQGLNIIMGLTADVQVDQLAPWVKRFLGRDVENTAPRKIVADALKRLDPEAQFDAWSSQLSIDVAKAMALTGIPRDLIPSPKKIDFILRTGGYWGQDIQKGYQIVREALGGRQRESARISDLPVIAGFTGVAARQSRSRDELFQLMSQSGGQLKTAAETYKNLLAEQGVPVEAARYLSRLEPEERIYAILAFHGSGSDKRMHPLERLQAVDNVASKLRKDVILDRLTPVRREGRRNVRDFDEKISLSPRQQTQIHEIMERIQQAEAWNSMILMSRPGWQGKKEIAVAPIMAELRAASPEVADLYDDRLAKTKALDWGDVKAGWPELRERIAREGVNAF